VDLIQSIFLGLLQGLTEFLPISSSGHLILIPFLTDFPDQGPMIDVAVHVGSLLAIVIYFWRDVLGLARGGFATVGLGNDPLQRRLFLWVVVGTIPAVAAGLGRGARNPLTGATLVPRRPPGNGRRRPCGR
jgi:undecaprenyl-diphosphatase